MMATRPTIPSQVTTYPRRKGMTADSMALS
jgi:hypothetical protein